MKPGGGKGKGAGFEREVCKRLSLWLSNGVRDDLLWRSAMSGGRATIGLKSGRVRNAQAGDISSIDSASSGFIDRFYVECKFYKDLQLGNIITKTNGNLVKFWTITEIEAVKVKKEPILIAKQNFRPALICMRYMPFLGTIIDKDNDLHIYPFDLFLTDAKPRSYM